MNIAVLSNSYGEDRSGAIIGREIRKLASDADIIGAPLISLGEEYKKRGIEVITGSPPPPSGGFPLKSFSGFWGDLVRCPPLIIHYITRLQKIKEILDDVIVVGDTFLLVLGWLALRRKMWFLAPCKSDYFSPHFRVERWLMDEIPKEIFTHDEFTAENLRKYGLNAVFLGNPMLDELEKEDIYKPPQGSKLIGILPGSRKEAYQNMGKIGFVLERLLKKRTDLHFAVAVSDTIDIERLKNFVTNLGHRIDFVKSGFVDIVSSSSLVLSLAGTASEQVAGIGIPIVSFIGTGPQTTLNRLKGQERLLGGCLRLVRDFPDGVVNEVLNLLEDSTLRKEMGNIGKERMGSKGGARRIAERIVRCNVRYHSIVNCYWSKV